jgi:hypothetical protein
MTTDPISRSPNRCIRLLKAPSLEVESSNPAAFSEKRNATTKKEKAGAPYMYASRHPCLQLRWRIDVLSTRRSRISTRKAYSLPYILFMRTVPVSHVVEVISSPFHECGTQPYGAKCLVCWCGWSVVVVLSDPLSAAKFSFIGPFFSSKLFVNVTSDTVSRSPNRCIHLLKAPYGCR